MNPIPRIICFGEILWDCLPHGRFLGGAPFNVAYHLAHCGTTPLLVTAVGQDAAGTEILQRLRQENINDSFISVDASHPTGSVIATIDLSGNAHYEIKTNAAWDHILLSETQIEMLSKSDAIVFGSLALRETKNQQTLERLLKKMPQAIRIFDVNLRAPFYSREAIESLARFATLIKLNDAELKELTGKSDKTLEENARLWADQTGCRQICVTAGAAGAGLLKDSEWFWTPAPKITVKDTIGAGDTFLARFVTEFFFESKDPLLALNRASELAGFVASQAGATPRYQLSELL